MSLPTYRVRRFQDPACKRKGYQATFQVCEEATGEELATCEAGRAALSVLEIQAADGVRWTSTPNRRVMPTKWDLAANGEPKFRFDSKVASKLLNPLARTSLSVLTPDGSELFAVVDPRTSVPDRMLGAGPTDWALLAGDRVLGRVVLLPRLQAERPGMLGKLRSWLAGSDLGLASDGESHVLPAPAALALIAIHRELTDPSAAG